jgi:hypothetical protein
VIEQPVGAAPLAVQASEEPPPTGAAVAVNPVIAEAAPAGAVQVTAAARRRR